jgi:hypothetical protein
VPTFHLQKKARKAVTRLQLPLVGKAAISSLTSLELSVISNVTKYHSECEP